MIAGCIRRGVGSAARRPGLVLLLWAWNLLLGFIAAVPAFRWWAAAFGPSPAADSLRTRFDLAVLSDLTKYEQVSPFGLLIGTVAGVALVALVAGAFVNGGILEVLATEGDRRSLLHRFFRGGGHFFGRYLRLLLLTVIGGLIVSGIVGAAAGAATAPLADSEWEPASYLVPIANLAVLALIWGWFYLAQDYARIRVAVDDSRGMVRAWFRGLMFVLRRPLGTYGIGIAMAVVSGLLLAVSFWYDNTFPSGTWAMLIALVLVQQVTLAGRACARVAMVAGERHFYLAALPPVAAPAPEFLTPPSEILTAEAVPTALGGAPDAGANEATPPGSSTV